MRATQGQTEPAPARRPWPAHGWLGLALVALAWPANWLLSGLRTHLLFFPLWLGYILTVDALVARRRGDSLLLRDRAGFVRLFAVSVPIWWLFELLNLRLGNWIYPARSEFGDLEYFFWSSLCFSTVVPAVFETAELVRGLAWLRRLHGGPRLPSGAAARVGYFAAGLAMLALLLAWPRYFFPFLWLALLGLSEPLCAALGRPGLLVSLSRGDWRPAASLATGALVCGGWWELWNYWSYPKWIYDVPFVDFAHVFEMPLLGYTGYLPFGMQLLPLSLLLLPRPLRLRL